VTSHVVGAAVTASADDPTAALLRGWLQTRLGVTPTGLADGHQITSVRLRFASGDEISAVRNDGEATLSRTGLPDRAMPLVRRQLGDQLAEELRRLDADQPYADALAAATNRAGLSARPGSRVHIWHDPQPA
jgi:glucose-6-phosphate dehydrogenase assembly protein OpcA